MSTIDTVYTSFIDSFAGNGSTTVFNTTFPVYQNTSTSHQLVVKTKVVATDVETTLVQNSDYTVTLSGSNPSTAVVTLTVAPATGTNLFLINDIEATQDINFTGSGTLDLDDVATAFNKAMLAIQQNLANQQELAVQLSATSGLSGIVLGTPVSDGIWKWNAAANAVEFTTIGSLVSLAAFDISDLTLSTALIGTDHLVGYDISLTTQVKSTITDVVEAGLLGLSTISVVDSDNDLVPIKDATDGSMKLVAANLIGGAAPDGSIKNIYTVTKTDSEALAVTANAWTAIPDITQTITPTDVNSKFLIVYTGNYEGSAAGTVFTDFFVDGKQLTEARAPINYKPDLKANSKWGSNTVSASGIMMEVYEPGSTQEFTVTVRISATTTGTMYINREGGDSDSAASPRGCSQLNIIELL